MVFHQGQSARILKSGWCCFCWSCSYPRTFLNSPEKTTSDMCQLTIKFRRGVGYAVWEPVAHWKNVLTLRWWGYYLFVPRKIWNFYFAEGTDSSEGRKKLEHREKKIQIVIICLDLLALALNAASQNVNVTVNILAVDVAGWTSLAFQVPKGGKARSQEGPQTL